MTAFSTRTLPLCGSGVLVPTGSVLGRRPPKPSTGRSVGAVRPHRIVRHFLMLRAGALSVTGGSPLAFRQVASLVVTPCANSTPGGHGRLTAQPANPSLSPSALCLPAFFN